MRKSAAMNEAVSEAMREAGRGYEKLFVPAVFGPWTKHLIAAAGLRDDARVLDIACGTGVLARHALADIGANGQVVGLDPAPGMIATAEELEAGIDWRLGSAEALAFEDKSFDRVLSQFGMMFFQDRDKAADEMFRVLKPNGKLVIAVWDSVDANPMYGEIIALLESQVGPAAADALRLPFCLGDPSLVTTPLEQAGFSGIEVATKVETANFPSSRHLVEAELRGWLPLFDIHLDEDKIAEVLRYAEETLAKYATDSGAAVFPTAAHVISARKG